MLKIGSYQLHSVLTSHFGLDGGAMFGIVPKALWSRKVNCDEQNRIEMVTRSLLITDGTRKILVDTGNGDKWTDKQRKIYNINTEKANIDTSLAKVGLTAEEITDVVVTHLHFDHVGGATKIVDGEVVPTFPNAKYYVQKQQLEHAANPEAKDGASFFVENWQVLLEKQLVVLDGPTELLPGIHLHTFHGHTPGQHLPAVSDGERTVFFCGDLFPTHHHIPYAWIMAYDLYPVTTLEEKKTILDKAHAEDWIFFYGHDSQAVTSGVEKTSKGFVAKNPMDCLPES